VRPEPATNKEIFMATLNLTIEDARLETDAIRSFSLKASNGKPLPAFTAGAHLKVHIPGLDEPRCYSLVCLANDAALFGAPARYRLGVRLEDPSQGGSRYMHRVAVGDTLTVEPPKNDFPVHAAEQDEPPPLLIAGGIGITPVASMAAELALQGRPFVLHYYGRSRGQMAFVETLSAQHGAALHLHADDDPATGLSLDTLLEGASPATHLYTCGPKGMIDAAVERAHARGWPQSHIHVELFTTPAPQSGDRGFDVELRQSGLTFHVPPDKTILEVLAEAGVDPMYDCTRGECGVCQVTVLEGTPDHRDYYLSDAEKKAGNVMQICVSRSLSDKLVLDL